MRQTLRPLPTRRRAAADQRTLLATLAPYFLLFLIFGLLPILYSLYLGFHRWDGLSPIRNVGLQNYARVWSDPSFVKALSNTLIIWLGSTLITVCLAFLLAFLINEYIVVGRTYFRMVFLLPLLVAPAVTAIIMRVIFSSDAGLINTVWGSLVGRPVYFDWFSSTVWIKPMIILMIVWRWTGWHLVIFLAGLQSVPADLYEVARVDGAKGRQILTHITIPLMIPTIAFSVITATIGGIQVFDEPFVLTNGQGGTDNAGLTLGMYLYDAAFKNFQFGLGSAVSYYVFILVAGFTLIYNALMKRSRDHA